MIPTQRATLLAATVTVFAGLTSCASGPGYDGPPVKSESASAGHPRDAIPRDEPKSRYGNGPYYQVYGKTYEVMDSARGYRERGVASWYGKKFHGRMTSNQEPYDMYAMTAAHKTLPLPSYVQVRNLKNNRTIVVRVNDRGPFIDNRLIDLSFAAARKLDLVRAGTGLVEVTAITPGDMPMTVDSTEPTNNQVDTATIDEQSDNRSELNKLFVQVGAFGEASNADRRHQHLHRNGIRSAFVHEESGIRGKLYRVRIGPIANVVEYDSIVAELGRLGITDTHLVTE